MAQAGQTQLAASLVVEEMPFGYRRHRNRGRNLDCNSVSALGREKTCRSSCSTGENGGNASAKGDKTIKSSRKNRSGLSATWLRAPALQPLPCFLSTAGALRLPFRQITRSCWQKATFSPHSPVQPGLDSTYGYKADLGPQPLLCTATAQ